MIKLRTYVTVAISILLWLIFWWYIATRPSSSFSRSVDTSNFIGYIQLTDDLILKEYMWGDDGAFGGVTYSYVLTDSISFMYNIGSHASDIILEYIIYKKHVTVKVFTIINATDSLAREVYRVPEEVPWEKEYKRLDDIIEIELPPYFKSTQMVDSVIVFIPR